MLREEIKQLKTGPRELRKFGLLVGAVFALLGIWFWFRGKGRYPYFLTPGAVLVVLGATVPNALRLIYVGWMTAAFLLGFVVSNILLTLFFYVVVTPIGLVARLAGRDFLNRKLDAQAKSYWIMRDRSSSRQKRNYEQQF
jgi:hypothetical protein